MIILLTLNKQVNAFIATSMVDNESITLTLPLQYGENCSKHFLTKRACLMLDSLFGRDALLCWTDIEHLLCFVEAVKKNLRFKIKQNSVILPKSVSDCFLDSDQITPTSFCEALNKVGMNVRAIYCLRGKIEDQSN